jgi:hypothetical protein
VTLTRILIAVAVVVVRLVGPAICSITPSPPGATTTPVPYSSRRVFGSRTGDHLARHLPKMATDDNVSTATKLDAIRDGPDRAGLKPPGVSPVNESSQF